MEKLTDQLVEVLSQGKKEIKEDSKIKKYMEAIARHDKLIHRGLTQKRGFQLLPVEKRARGYYSNGREGKTAHF